MGLLLLLHAAVGLGILGGSRRLRRTAAAVGLLAPLATLVWLGTRLGAVRDGIVATESIAWVPALGLTFDVRLDGFAALLVLLISGIGALVLFYARWYFEPDAPGVGRLLGLLVLFSGSMLGLVLADHLLVLYGFWELTSITSYFLIGNHPDDPDARAASLQALLITGAGGLAMLAGFVLLGSAAGTFRLGALLAAPPSGPTVTAALLLVLAGAATKSAQVPFHSWLPGAMVAPTPVSAYLHSATMVKAGIVLLARFAPSFLHVPWWQPIAITLGLVTMLWGGWVALRQTDLKALLAYGTVSQLGLLFVVMAIGSPGAVVAGTAMLVAHALFKAALFLAVGVIDHQASTRDLRRLPRLGPGWGVLTATTVVAGAAMAGVPLTFGFVAKEAVLTEITSALALSEPLTAAVRFGVVAGVALTAAYTARLLWGTFVAPRRRSEPVDSEPAPAPPTAFVLAAAALAAPLPVLGLVPGAIDPLLGPAAAALLPAAGAVAHLAVWHGFTTPLVLSLGAIAAGIGGAIAAARRTVPPRPRPLGTEAFDHLVRGLDRTATAVTGVVQSGSLPVYSGIILVTATVLPAGALLLGGADLRMPPLTDGAAGPVVAAVLLGSALGAAAVRRRFSAALLLGTAGYAMAGLFVVQGAPDLALTQVAIETLTTVLFVLVLRRLPDRFERRTGSLGRAARVAVATTVGTVVFVLALAAGSRPMSTEVSDQMVARALPDGKGRNVVNVILVDFRGFDTLGEITVLAAAAIGAVALARAGRRPGAAAGEPLLEDTAASPEDLPPLRRLFPLDQSMSLIFYAMIVGSIYLLFAGHDQPGGGFVGGIVAGAAVALRYVAGGLDEVRRVSPLAPWTFLGAGLLLAAGTAVAPVLFGAPVLDHATWSSDLPVVGAAKLPTTVLFDLGVYFVVVGVVLMVFEAFGERVVPDDETASVPAPVEAP